MPSQVTSNSIRVSMKFKCIKPAVSEFICFFVGHQYVLHQPWCAGKKEEKEERNSAVSPEDEDTVTFRGTLLHCVYIPHTMYWECLWDRWLVSLNPKPPLVSLNPRPPLVSLNPKPTLKCLVLIPLRTLLSLRESLLQWIHIPHTIL